MTNFNKTNKTKIDPHFRVDVISSTPKPQTVCWLAMHQDYSEEYVYHSYAKHQHLCDGGKFPTEAECGEYLIKHCLNKKHFGVVEHPSITFNVGYFPHTVMQQARTHRVGTSFDVQCLSGDSQITLVNITGNKSQVKTMSELYDLWTNGEKKLRYRAKRGRNGEPPGYYRRDMKKRLRKIRIRSLDENNNTFTFNHLEEVVFNGLNPVYQVTLADGKSIKCTQNHKIFTPYGWRVLSQLSVGQEVMVNGQPLKNADKTYQNKEWLKCNRTRLLDKLGHFCAKCQSETKLHLHHIVPVSENIDLAFDDLNFEVLCASCHVQHHKKGKANPYCAHPVKIIAIEYAGVEPTYDLVMSDPHHNFVADGIVVHNSNRYTGQRIMNFVESEDYPTNFDKLEKLFYLRPVGQYSDRQGDSYFYSEDERLKDLLVLIDVCLCYYERRSSGLSEEHARDLIPYSVRQHFVVSFNARSLMHFLALRWKKDAQLEIQQMCDLMYLHFCSWMPQVAKWYGDDFKRVGTIAP